LSNPYRPSNGSEGMDFLARWCDRCAKDAGGKVCDIIAETMARDVDDKNYPKEWVYEAPAGEGRCTAFEAVGKEVAGENR